MHSKMHIIKKVLFFILKGLAVIFFAALESAGESALEENRKFQNGRMSLDGASSDSIAYHIATGQL